MSGEPGVPTVKIGDVGDEVTDIDEYHFQYIKLKCDPDITRKLSYDRGTKTMKLDGLHDNTSKRNTVKIAHEAKHIPRKAVDLEQHELEKAKDVAKECQQNSEAVIFFNESSSPKQLIIMAPNERIVQENEHKAKVEIGRIKTITRRKDRFSSLTAPINATSSSPENLDPNRNFASFVTFEKIRVHIGNRDLASMEVDCIVNPINIKNTGSGQISRALLEAGGPLYSKQFFNVRDVEMTKCVVTSDGDLKAKHVIHAVCPKKGLLFKGSTLEEDIFQTVENCLFEAEKLGIDSIAFPTICAGRRQIPIDICSKQYANAILEFSRKRTNMFVVNNIYFVDISEDKFKNLKSTFSDTIPGNTNEILEMPKEQPRATGMRASYTYQQTRTGYTNIEVKERESSNYKASGARVSDALYETVRIPAECKTDRPSDPPYENQAKRDDPPYENEAKSDDPPYDKPLQMSQRSNAYEEMCNYTYESLKNDIEGCVDIKEEETGVQPKEVHSEADVLHETAKGEADENGQSKLNSSLGQQNESVDGPGEDVDGDNGGDSIDGYDENGDGDKDDVNDEVGDGRHYDTIDQGDSIGYDTIQNASAGMASDETLTIGNEKTCENVTYEQHGVDAKEHDRGGGGQTHRGSQVVQGTSHFSAASNIPETFSNRAESRAVSVLESSVTIGRFKTKNGCEILAYQDDIRNIKRDAIVCPEKTSRPTGGFLAAAIKATYRHSFREKKLEKLRRKDRHGEVMKPVAVTECEKENVEYILHTATPFRSESMDDDTFRQDLIKCLPRVFKKIEDQKKQRKIKSVAFPIMGIDNVQNEPAVFVACRVLAESVVACCEAQTTVREVHLVNKCQTITRWLIQLLDAKVNGT